MRAGLPVAGPVERLRRLVLGYGAGRITQPVQVFATARGFDILGDALDPRVVGLAARIMPLTLADLQSVNRSKPLVAHDLTIPELAALARERLLAASEDEDLREIVGAVTPDQLAAEMTDPEA